jgi:hypothetical protein
MINVGKKIILSLCAASALTIIPANLHAQAFNEEDSGVFINASIGAAQSESFLRDNGSFNFPSQSSFTGAAGAGYQFAFGKKDNWKEFYTGISINYYNFGQVIDPFTSSSVNTNSTTLSALGAEIFLRKYFNSPFSIEVGLGIGANVSGFDETVQMGTFKFRAGYDILENFTVFIEYLGAGFQNESWSPVFFGSYLQFNSNGVSISTEQLGLQYTF